MITLFLKYRKLLLLFVFFFYLLLLIYILKIYSKYKLVHSFREEFVTRAGSVH